MKNVFKTYSLLLILIFMSMSEVIAQEVTITASNNQKLELTVSHFTSDQTIQWQSSTDNKSWTEISGATTNNYVITLTSLPKYFRAKIDADSCETFYSEPVLVNELKKTCNIVILGSSTARGTGAIPISNSWAELYKKELLKINSKYRVINLGKGGTSTYNILPDGSSIPANERIDSERNITKALSYNPTAIIVNMPSNDTAKNYSLEEQMNNFKTLVDEATTNNVSIWIATTQPRNFKESFKIQRQVDVKNEILKIYGEKAIDFWSNIASSDGLIKTELDSGDGIHLNNEGHALLFKRALNKSRQSIGCRL